MLFFREWIYCILGDVLHVDVTYHHHINDLPDWGGEINMDYGWPSSQQDAYFLGQLAHLLEYIESGQHTEWNNPRILCLLGTCWRCTHMDYNRLVDSVWIVNAWWQYIEDTAVVVQQQLLTIQEFITVQQQQLLTIQEFITVQQQQLLTIQELITVLCILRKLTL